MKFLIDKIWVLISKSCIQGTSWSVWHIVGKGVLLGWKQGKKSSFSPVDCETKEGLSDKKLDREDDLQGAVKGLASLRIK